MTSKKIRLLILNAFSNNLGDQAIMVGFLHTFYPAALRYGIELEIHQEFVYSFEIREKNIDEINAKYDLIVIGGGGLIFDRPGDNSVSGWGMNIPIELLDRLRVPFVVYAAGYNYLPYQEHRFPEITKSHLQKSAAQAVLFSAREQGTIDRLVTEMEIESPLQFVPDPAIHVRPRPVSLSGMRPEALKVGVCLRLDNLEHRLPQPTQHHFDFFLSEVVQSLKRLVDEENCQVVHIPHLFLHNDRIFYQMLEKQLPAGALLNLPDVMPELYEGAPRSANPEILAGVYSQMDVVLGKRLHSNILPFAVGTPVVAISSTQSNRWMLEKFGCPEFHIDVCDFQNQVTSENIYCTIMKAHEQRDRLTALYRQKKAEFVMAAESAHAKIFESL